MQPPSQSEQGGCMAGQAFIEISTAGTNTESWRLPAGTIQIPHGLEEVSIKQSPSNIRDVIRCLGSWHVQWQQCQGCLGVLKDAGTGFGRGSTVADEQLQSAGQPTGYNTAPVLIQP